MDVRDGSETGRPPATDTKTTVDKAYAGSVVPGHRHAGDGDPVVETLIVVVQADAELITTEQEPDVPLVGVVGLQVKVSGRG